MIRVLLVDDDENVRYTLARVLRKAGYEVVEAEEGGEALECLNKQPVDVVVTDILMPGMEGIETIMKLREQAAALPIIAISGGGRVGLGEYLESAKLLGADYTFEKPFDERELIARIEELAA